MKLTLTELPPPLSACYRNFAIKTKSGKVASSRAKTKRYEGWQAKVITDIYQQQGPHLPIMIPVCVLYHVKRPVNKDGKPTKRVQDLDNLCKALGDILTQARIIEDDNLIHDLRIRWASPSQKTAVEIQVELL